LPSCLSSQCISLFHLPSVSLSDVTRFNLDLTNAAEGEIALDASKPLPGIPAAWMLDQTAAQVLEASRRLLQLQQLLGSSGRDRESEDVSSSYKGGKISGARGGAGGVGGRGDGAQMGPDVSWMVVREPRLLTADYGELTRRLLDMKVRGR
jgi:hypothetical protein